MNRWKFCKSSRFIHQTSRDKAYTSLSVGNDRGCALVRFSRENKWTKRVNIPRSNIHCKLSHCFNMSAFCTTSLTHCLHIFSFLIFRYVWTINYTFLLNVALYYFFRVRNVGVFKLFLVYEAIFYFSSTAKHEHTKYNKQIRDFSLWKQVLNRYNGSDSPVHNVQHMMHLSITCYLRTASARLPLKNIFCLPETTSDCGLHATDPVLCTTIQ